MTTDQPELFPAPEPPSEPPKRYTLHGENREGIGTLETGVVGWSFSDGIWWMTNVNGGLTGYNFKHYFWLSLRPEGDS